MRRPPAALVALAVVGASLTKAGEQPTCVPAIQLGEGVTMLVGDHRQQLRIAAAPQTFVHTRTVAPIERTGSPNHPAWSPHRVTAPGHRTGLASGRAIEVRLARQMRSK